MERRKLTGGNIEWSIRELQTFFEKSGADRLYILRMRLAVEEMLLSYRDRFGEEAEFSLDTGKLLRFRRFEIRIYTEEYNPLEDADEYRILGNMMARNELAPRWDYQRHSNRILCTYNKKQTVSAAVWLLIAFAAAILLGILTKEAPDGFLRGICAGVVIPISQAIMRLMSLFASFMIFWSIMTGICSMGDVSTFNNVGKRIIRRYLCVLGAVCAAGAVLFLLWTPLSRQSGNTVEYGTLVSMILDIIPKDPFSPFISGNTLQLVFIAFILGITLLVLKSRIGTTVFDLIQDMNEVSQYILSVIVTLMPFIVFASTYQFMINNDLQALLTRLEFPLTVLAVLILAFLILFFSVCFRRKVSPRVLLGKLWPVMQIVLSTASSSAAYLKTVDTCEKKMGVDPRLVKIGVPLGPSIFKPGSALLLLSVVFLGIKWYDLPLTIPAVVSIIFSVFLLSISVPPIPGGMPGVYVILFASFGIPEEMMAIVLAFDALTDRLRSTVNQTAMMLQLTEVSASLKMLDEDVLRAPGKES